MPTTAPPASAAPAASAPATSAAPSTAAGGGVTDTLQIHWLGDLTAIWHPASQETFSQAVNFQLMFDKLLERKWDGDTWKPVADLADTWDVSPDGLTWTFHLHPGVKWHDGEPFTANDVAFTVSRALLNTQRNPQNAWAAVVGVDKVTDPNAIASGVKVIDDNTISLTIGAPNADFVSDLTDPSAFIVPQHILKDTDPKAVETIEFSTTKPIGTGPVQVRQVRDGPVQPVRGEPGLLPWAPPKIKNIFVKRLLGDQAIAQLESGDLDLSVRLNPAEQGRLEKAPNLDVLSTSGVGTYGPYMNLLPLTDVKTREAIALGVDAQGIIDSIYGGAGHINRGVLPGMPAADDQVLLRLRPGQGQGAPRRIVVGQEQAAPDRLRQVVRRRRAVDADHAAEPRGHRLQGRAHGPGHDGRHRGVRQDRHTTTSPSPRAAPRASGRSSRRSTSAASRPSRPTSRPIRGTAPSTMASSPLARRSTRPSGPRSSRASAS